MIPYTLADKYKTSITTYNNDQYTYMDNLLKHENFTLNYLENTGNQKEDVTRYIKQNAQNIDILQLYHLRYDELPAYVKTYKKHNKKGKIYLKLDANNDIIDFLVKRKGIKPAIRRFITKQVFKKIDLISIETIRNYQVLQEIIPPEKLAYIPNGILKIETPNIQKEKTILYVGNIEKENKSIDMLLEATANINLADWKIVLIGQCTQQMKEYITDLTTRKPEMKEKIILKGYIDNKKQLATEYAKASIYTTTSKKESFGISTLEAAYHGNYILSTKVGASPDIIKTTQYGQIINYNQKELEQALQNTINNWETIKQDTNNIQEKVYQEYSWHKQCKKIIEKIEDKNE